jgi:hypothetical protein
VSHARRSAALFAVGYLLLGMAWLGSNPPGAAPDEPDHLVKALGVARFDIGAKYTGAPLGPGVAGRRNASLARVVEIPARLQPTGYTCMAFKPALSAGCQHKVHAATSTATVAAVTTVGVYPPFVYLPAGLLARAAHSPPAAFRLARLGFLLVSSLLVFAAARHLCRWVGPRHLLGLSVGLTPAVVFTMGSCTTSGVEITAAAAVAAVVLVALRRPESLDRLATHVTLAAAGATLALSRQLGTVALAVLVLVGVLGLGLRHSLQRARARLPMFAATASVLAAAALAAVVWEARYDHPSDTGSLLSASAGRRFGGVLVGAVNSGVGDFGWLDTQLPTVWVGLWLCAIALLGGVAVLLGCRRDRWALLCTAALTALVAYVVYATVFAPLPAALQGRHLLPMLMFPLLLSTAVVVERLPTLGLGVELRGLLLVIAPAAAAVQLIALWCNARRYAVGVNGPLWFVGSSQWHPPGGWAPWFTLGAAGALLSVWVMIGAAGHGIAGAVDVER